MHRICAITGESFEVTDTELELIARFDATPPTLCPDERVRRRMMFANQRNLFVRNCDATGKRVVTYYPPDAEAKIYEIGYWWGDAWDQHATARDYDFSRPFFDQFYELMKVAPRPSMHRGFEFDENAEYTNYAGQNKDCYLIFDSDLCRDCYYSYSINSCRDCIDCFRTESCELCYECVDCSNCYGSDYLQNCANCSDSWFLKNCIGCQSCFGCVNLKNRRNCFFNEQLSPDAYKRRIAALNLQSRSAIAVQYERFQQFQRTFPYRATEGIQNEDCVGSYLSNSKNAYLCFDSRGLWDCRYVTQAFGDCKDCLDCTEIGMKVEFNYENAYGGFPSHTVRFSSHCFPGGANVTYCYFCPSSSNLFGCVGLHHKKHCILNKQYSEKDYYALEQKIVEQMKQNGEWGEHFPHRLTPFEYNVSIANDFYPLTKKEALARGYRWREEDAREFQKSSYTLPDTIAEVEDSVLKEMLACSATGKNFKLQSGELTFYQKMQLPLPDRCFDVRHTARLAMRNPRKLYKTTCAISGREIYTSVPKELGVKIVSEEEFAKLLS